MKEYKFIGVMLSMLTLPVLAQSVPGGTSPTTNRLVLAQTHEYLRQPNGLEKLSARVGDITLNEPDERWGQQHDLSSLVEGSDLIVVATISKMQGYLAEDGDSVRTICTVQVNSALKGRQAKDLAIDIAGGSLVLSTGHTAAIHTSLLDSLEVGKAYVFYLKAEDGRYHVFGAIQGVMPLSELGDEVHLADKDPVQSVALRRDVDGLSLAALRNRVADFVSAN